MAEKKKTKKKPTRPKRDPTPAQLFNRVTSTKALSKEIKGMSKIFKENQRILVAMSDMMESLNTTMAQMQKQSKQIGIIEEDTQRLFSGLNQVKVHEKFITKLNKQTDDLDRKMSKINDKPKTQEIMKTVNESIDSIRNNSKMIMTIANRVDDVKEKIDEVSKKGGTSEIKSQIDELRENIKSITNRTGDIGNDMSNLKNEIGGIISNPKIPTLIGEGMKTFKSEIEEKISNISNMINRSDEMASEFHKKTDKIIHEMQGIKGVTSKA